MRWSSLSQVHAVGTGDVYTACVGIQYRNGGGPPLLVAKAPPPVDVIGSVTACSMPVAPWPTLVEVVADWEPLSPMVSPLSCIALTLSFLSCLRSYIYIGKSSIIQIYIHIMFYGICIFLWITNTFFFYFCST